jgi:hypothetical protein
LAAKVVFKKYLSKEEGDENAVGAFFQRWHQDIAGRFNSRNTPGFLFRQISASIPEEAGESAVEQRIKLCSIAAGWEAAGHTGIPVAGVEA